MSTQSAKGNFSVDIKPQSDSGAIDGVSLGRLSLDKRYEGDLVATAVGEMLTAMTEVKGSAAYVAVERVSGTLHGRRGSFALYHTGTMSRGAQQLAIAVVPDSGAGELKGIEGTLTIRIEAGQHYYELTYQLPG